MLALCGELDHGPLAEVSNLDALSNIAAQPEIVGQVGDGVEREGQQVEDGKDGREVLLAVACSRL